MFSAIAPTYDLNNRLHSFGCDQAWRRASVRLVGVRPSDRVLDAACGTGDLALAFARAGPACVVGVDFAQPMLDLAHVKARRFASADAVTPEFRHADVTALPFNDASFDVVSIAFGLRNVDRPEAALAEFRRVLAPGGRVVILEFSEPKPRWLRGLNRLYTERIMPFTASMIARDRTGAYRYLPRSVRTFAGPAQLADMLTQAGFVNMSSRRMTFGVCVATVAHVPK
jgi:demethylmenaquinone methyltransferase/2-methoxy-6-polyprenyl-1,4-benzoquinol methylase